MNRRMKQWLGLLVVLVGVVGMKAWASNTPVDATISVTPVANVSLSIAPTTYAFGNQNVAGGAFVSASSLTLTNNGQVGVTVNKEVKTEPAAWTSAAAA